MSRDYFRCCGIIPEQQQPHITTLPSHISTPYTVEIEMISNFDYLTVLPHRFIQKESIKCCNRCM
jgi:hypothetical protein